MVSVQRTVTTLLSMVGIMGLGAGLWMGLTPDETQMKERAKDLPRSSPQHLAEQRRLNAEVMAIIKEAAETNENVVRRSWPWHK